MLFFLYKNIRKQKAFLKKTIENEISTQQSNVLDNQDLYKMLYYYGLSVPAILGEAFCQLRGKKMSINERHTLTYMGAATGIFDDLFDKLNTPVNHILNLIDNNSDAKTNNVHEKLLIKFSYEILKNHNAKKIRQIALELFEIQRKSLKQKNKSISNEELLNITLEKGGLSIIFYRCCFEEKIENNEYELLLKIGEVGQLTNDIFDMYKDFSDGIETIANRTTNITELKNFLLLNVSEIKSKIDNLNYKTKNLNKFFNIVYFIVCRAFVCIDMLEKLEKSNNGKFQIEKFTKSQLTCNMESASNRLKLIKYFIKKRLS